MATSRRVSFLASASVGVGVATILGGCVCNPPAPTPSADLSTCRLVSDASKEKLVRGQCYVFYAPETRGIKSYSVYVDSELRVIVRGCGGGGGGGGGGGQYGNGGGGGGGSNFGSDAVSLPAIQNIEIKVGKGGQGGSYRPRGGQCETGPDRHNDSVPVDHGCAGERGESTLITAENFRFEFKGGEGGSGGASTPDFNAGIGGKSVRWGGAGGKGGAAMHGAGNRSTETANAYGAAGERSIDLFGSPPGKGGAWDKRGDIALAGGGGGGGGGFHYSLKKEKERGKGGNGASSSLSNDRTVIGSDAEDGGFCGGGGGGAGWEGTAHHSRGGDGGHGLLILDLR